MFSRPREKIVTSSPFLWTWQRKPSYFGSTEQRPSRCRISSTPSARSASAMLHRVAHAHHDAGQRLRPAAVERFGHQPDVAGQVVGALQRRAQRLVARLGQRERVEHRGIAHAHAQPPDDDARDPLGGQRRHAVQQVGQQLQLALHAARRRSLRPGRSAPACTAISVVPASAPSHARLPRGTPARPGPRRRAPRRASARPRRGSRWPAAMARTASFSLMPNSFWRYSGARRPWIR